MSLVNKRELAELMGKSERTLSTWMKDEGLPVHADGGRGRETHFDTVSVFAWYAQRAVLKEIGEGSSGEAISYDAERARLTKAQADHEELKVRLLEGRVIPAETVERVQGAMVSNCRAKLLALPSKATPAVSGMGGDTVEIEATLTDYVRETLEELGDFDPGPYLSADIQALEASAEADGEPVGGRSPRTKRGGKRRAGEVAH